MIPFGEDRPGPGRFSFGSGVERDDFANMGKALDHAGDTQVDTRLVELTSEEAKDHQSQDTIEGMNPELLVRPMVGGTEGEEMGIFHASEGGFDMGLAAVSRDNGFIAPVVTVCEEEGFTEKRPLKVFPFLIVKAPLELREGAPGFFDRRREKVFHVASGQDGLDSIPGALESGFFPFAGRMGMSLEGGLEGPEFLLTFADLASESFELCRIEGAVERDEDGALNSKHFFRGSVGPDGRQKVGIEAMHVFSAYRQEVGMLGGHEGADEVERSLSDGIKVFLRVVSLVKDQGKVTDPLAQDAAPLGQFFGDTAKGGGIMLVACIGVMQQRDVAVGGDQQRQAQEAQVIPSILAVASLGKCRTVVKAVDEGKEIGGIKEQASQIEAKARDGGGGDLLLNGSDSLFVDPIHIIPKPLTTQLRGLDTDQAREDRFFIPLSDLGLASGGDTAIEGSHEEVLTDRGALSASFGDMAINGRDDIELLSHVESGDDGAEFPDDPFLGSRLGESEDQLLRRADVLLPDDLGFAVDPSALAEVVIGVSADELFSEAGH